MKLLFDHNLSPKLVRRLSDLYPESQHIFLLGLEEVEDRIVWDYASEHHFIIVTRDSDFSELSTFRGFPPKIIWIRRGNCSTSEIEEILRAQYEAIAYFSDNPTLGVLTLY